MRLAWIGGVGLLLAGGCGQARPGDEPSPDSPPSVRAGEDFQQALDAAQPGDVITLEAGAVFTGPFTLPDKPGGKWITIRTSAGGLPPPGTRVSPSHAPLMPKLESSSGSVITAAPRAHHYRLVGIEIRPTPGAFLYTLVTLGEGEKRLDLLPHDITFERCYLHGDPRLGSRRGIALNSRETTVVDSYLADFKEVGADSQAIAGWNGPGPFRIENNRLEGAGENVLFGGADPSVPGLVPSDIEIRRNHLVKPVAWKAGEPGYEETPWTVKNLFELKNARRVIVEGNLLENNWADAQSGFAVLFTVRNQEGTAPWSVVEDVTFANNIVRHTAAGVNVLGRDNNAPSGQANTIRIRNNLFEDVGGSRWGGGGHLFQLLDGTKDVVIEHNTALNAGSLIVAEGAPHAGFVFRDNIAFHNRYGVVGAGTAPGRSTLDVFFPGSLFRRNVIIGGNPGLHPPDNFFPPSVDQVGFVDRRASNYRLAEGSPYKRAATDGRDVGTDFDVLLAAHGLAAGP